MLFRSVNPNTLAFTSLQPVRVGEIYAASLSSVAEDLSLIHISLMPLAGTVERSRGLIALRMHCFMARRKVTRLSLIHILITKVVSINRVSKTVKGGRIMKFAALVVVGDGKGTIGYGIGKSGEVPEAIRKGEAAAKKNMHKVALKGTTIPHEIVGKYRCV